MEKVAKKRKLPWFLLMKNPAAEFARHMKIIDKDLGKVWKEPTPQEWIAANKEDIHFAYKTDGSNDLPLKRNTGCA